MKGVTPYQFGLLTQLDALERTLGKLPDLDQLLERLSWAPSKASAQFTIRAVIGKGLVEKAPLEFRRGRKRVCYRLTAEGRLALDPRPAAAPPAGPPVPKGVESSVPGLPLEVGIPMPEVEPMPGLEEFLET